MNRNAVTALLLAALFAVTLPLIYLLFANVILPTAWDEEPAGVPNPNASELPASTSGNSGSN